jgi:hypothetical protein
MTRRDDEHHADERRLARLVSDALGDELAPTTVAEVERAEAEGLEHEGPLPEALRELRPRGAASPSPPRARVDGPPPPPVRSPDADGARSVASLESLRARRGGARLASHAVAAITGAVAAAAALALLAPSSRRGGGHEGAPGPDPTPRAPDAAALAPLVTVPGASCTDACCAGAACPSAGELSACSSGRTCVACSLTTLAESRYRLRLGAFTPTSLGRDALEHAPGGLELCARVGASELACAPAATADAPGERWTILPLVPSADELAAGFELRVRPRGLAATIASVEARIQVNPALLCKGTLLRPLPTLGRDAGAAPPDPLGTISLFLDDTYWVEVARADAVPTLRAARERFAVAPGALRVIETDRPAHERFTLALGPYDRAHAERVRWSLLEQGESARVDLGGDHVGAPLPLE